MICWWQAWGWRGFRLMLEFFAYAALDVYAIFGFYEIFWLFLVRIYLEYLSDNVTVIWLAWYTFRTYFACNITATFRLRWHSCLRYSHFFQKWAAAIWMGCFGYFCHNFFFCMILICGKALFEEQHTSEIELLNVVCDVGFHWLLALCDVREFCSSSSRFTRDGNRLKPCFGRADALLFATVGPS